MFTLNSFLCLGHN